MFLAKIEKMCLPQKKFIHIVASLEQVLDLNTTRSEDIMGRLKAYEKDTCEDKKDTCEDKKTVNVHKHGASRKSIRVQ